MRFFIRFSLVLVPQVAQHIIQPLIKLSVLIVHILLLVEFPLKHLNLLTQLVILELVFICLAPDFFVALFPQLAELAFFFLFNARVHFFGFF